LKKVARGEKVRNSRKSENPEKGRSGKRGFRKRGSRKSGNPETQKCRNTENQEKDKKVYRKGA
jgi:hypothetical protein